MKTLIRVLCAVSIGLLSTIASAEGQKRPLRIAHVNSYHADWSWSAEQEKGFKAAMVGVDYELRVFEMDTKRKPDEKWKQSIATQIRADLAQYKPDLIFLTDDNAQHYVGRHYVNSSIPIVFSGVNATPDEYGYQGARNVTGVLEREPVLETVTLLREMSPSVRRIVVLSDIDKTWVDVTKRIREQVPQRFPDMEVVTPEPLERFEDYKALIAKYAGTPTAFASLGIYALKDDKGVVLPFEQVIQWTAEHSRNPDFTFWADRVEYGTLCAVRVNGVEQGREAGALAKQILVGGKRAASLPVVAVTKGYPAINLARAHSLGIRPTSTHLLSAVVAPKLGWTARR